ncbi:helix-turn-helix domain-containing protein [Sphingobacterium sp.]|uniref:helix-turn-helix domain-containing protein n=1 Tax=Sphingobacterium sp. TaxID=341027 RepID=UPI0028AC56FA|nr:helix-turn-helix domain-containing protein [Sphingobacterium sp.]
MRIIKDKSLILNKIKLHYGFKTDAQFAKFLGIKPNSLSNWYSRNTMDYELVFSKCDEIDGNWIFTGEGDMLKSYMRQTNVLPLNKDFPSNCEELREKYIKLLEEYTMLLKSKLNGDPSTDKSVS